DDDPTTCQLERHRFLWPGGRVDGLEQCDQKARDEHWAEEPFAQKLHVNLLKSGEGGRAPAGMSYVNRRLKHSANPSLVVFLISPPSSTTRTTLVTKYTRMQPPIIRLKRKSPIGCSFTC